MTWSRLNISLVLSVSLAAISCSPKPPTTSGPREILERWISIDPGGTVNPGRLFTETTASTVTFNTPSVLESWAASGVDSAEIVEGALELRGLGTDALVQSLMDFSAEDFSVLEVSVERFGRGRLTVAWDCEHEPCEVSLDSNSAQGDAVRRFSFELGRQPQWTGRISNFRLLPQSVSKQPIRVLSLRMLMREVDLGNVVNTLTAGARIEFNADARPALPALPGRTITRKLDEIPPGASLHLSTGVDAMAGSSWILSVQIEGPGRPPETLWSDTIEPGKSLGSWTDLDLPLERFTGTDMLIHLVTEGPKPHGGLAWWADPRIEVPSDQPHVNVIVILLDTLRADRMSAYGAPQSTTPFLKRWISSNGILFENVVAPAPWTLPSHVSLFSGLNAVRHGVNHHMQAPDSLRFLAEYLRDAGYTTAAVTGGGILRPHYGFAQGFDSFSYWSSRNSVNELKHGLHRASEFLETHRDLPFFLFLHTYEIHYPHRRRQPFFDTLVKEQGTDLPQGQVKMLPPKTKNLVSEGNTFSFLEKGKKKWSSPLTPDEKRMVRTMYDSAIAYTDSSLASLFDLIDRLDLREDTLIVVTSDHGEALGEEDRAGHSFLDDYNLMVPLMLELPGRQAAGTRISRQVRLIDLMPTVLDVTGVPFPSDLDGQTLVPLIEGPDSTFPSDAWTYAASSNRGLALRHENQEKFTFNDTAWQRVWGQSTLVALPETGATATDSEPESPDITGFREAARSLLETDFAGTRILLSNNSDGVLQGHLKGTWNQRSGVKSAAADCGCLRWTHSGGSFELKPHENLSLLISPGKGGEGGISGTYQPKEGTASPFNIAMQRGEPAEALQYFLVGSSWHRRSLDPGRTKGEGISITIRSTGPRLDTDDENTLGDEAISQLRALGYLQ